MKDNEEDDSDENPEEKLELSQVQRLKKPLKAEIDSCVDYGELVKKCSAHTATHVTHSHNYRSRKYSACLCTILCTQFRVPNIIFHVLLETVCFALTRDFFVLHRLQHKVE